MGFNVIPKEAFDMVKEVYGDIAKPSAQKAGEAVANTLSLVFLPFNCLGMTVDELKGKYKEFITGAFKKVEPEKLQPPPATIAGPVFEHIKYRFTEPEVVEMFSNLLAGSMDSDKCEFVHPTLIYILQQMTNDDAELFRFVVKETRNDPVPIDELVFSSPATITDIEKKLRAFGHLLRLNLIDKIDEYDSKKIAPQQNLEFPCILLTYTGKDLAEICVLEINS